MKIKYLICYAVRKSRIACGVDNFYEMPQEFSNEVLRLDQLISENDIWNFESDMKKHFWTAGYKQVQITVTGFYQLRD